MKKCVKSSLDLAPSLFLSFDEDFEYFDSRGTVIAAHSGTVHIASDCSLLITGYELMTWYSHISITVKPFQEVEQGDVIGFIETRRSVANCDCDVVECKPKL